MFADLDPRSTESDLVRKSVGVWFELHGCITDKERNSTRFPNLRLNEMQSKIDEIILYCEEWKIPCRIVTLKGRQQGSSTISNAAVYHMARRRATKICIIGDEFEKSVKNMVDMFNNYAKEDTFDWGSDYNPPSGKFTNGSMLGTETANDPRAGASGTMQAVLMTETAHWPETKAISGKATYKAIMACVPKKAGTLVIMESTPNGIGGIYHSTYTQAITIEQHRSGQYDPKLWNGYFKVFYPWHAHSEYDLPCTPTEEQEILASLDDTEQELLRMGLPVSRLNWRRMMIATDFDGDPETFQQEYATDEESCLTGDTRVGTSRGIVPISEVEVGTQCDHGEVVAKKRVGVKPVVRVTTKYGYTLRCTYDHRFAVGDGFVEAKDLLGRSVQLQVPTVNSDIYSVGWTGFAGVRNELRITEDWGAFIGYFAGNGSFGGDVLSMCLNYRDTDLAVEMGRLVEMVMGKPAAQRRTGTKKGGLEIRISNKRLKDVLEQLGLLQTTRYENGSTNITRKPCVPECIWRSPKPVIRKFLSYLFEADGWISTTAPVVKFFSKYADFCRDVQRLLLVFGIRCGITSVSRSLNGNNYPGTELSLKAVDSIKFVQEIGFVSERKRSAVDGWTESRQSTWDRYDYLDEVVSVEPDGEEEVWDIQIEGSAPVFGANGILVHNCFLNSGRATFPRGALKNMLAVAKREGPGKLKTGVLQWADETEGRSVYRLTDDEEAWVKIWETPTPGLRYLSVTDPATGRATGKDPDNHASGIIRDGYWDSKGDWHAPALVARLADCYKERQVLQKGRPFCQWDISLLEERIAMLSAYYGWAPVVVELNMDSGLISKLVERNRATVFRRVIPNRIEQTESKEYGWMTTEKTRLGVIEELRRRIRHWEAAGDGMMVWDPAVIGELSAMITLDNGRAEAMTGNHDDTVLMLGIGFQTISTAKMMPIPRRGRSFHDDDEPTRDFTFR